MLSYRDITTLYVSPDGKGNGKNWHENVPGNGPAGSLQDVLKMIDQMRGSGMLQPLTVKMLAGEYDLTAPLQITPRISNVNFMPFGNGPVLISGGKRITGFQVSSYNGVRCFAAYVPEVKEGFWSFTDLYVNGLRADRTRYPQKGFMKMLATEHSGEELHDCSVWFQAASEDLQKIASFRALKDCYISFNHYWVDEHTPIESFDEETGRITMAYTARYTIRPEQEYIIENVSEMFLNPNEWYLDRAEGMLYYIPRDDSITSENIAVYAPVTFKLLEIHGLDDSDRVSGVRFTGIHFAYTKGEFVAVLKDDDGNKTLYASSGQSFAEADASISLRYASNSTFSHCVLTNFGIHGFSVNEGCRNVTIDHCRIYDGGAGGVKINGSNAYQDQKGATTGIQISDCSISHLGQRYYCGCGILAMHVAECRFIHNEIHDLYYTGISCGWTWGYAHTNYHDNLIAWNHIYDLGKGKLSDMGGIYMLGNQPGTVVAYNRIHNIRCKEYGGWALYTDEGSTGMTLENNLCYRTSSNSYHQHYGSCNVVRNNIFADAKEALMAVSRPEAHLSILFTGNILYSTGSPMMSTYKQTAPGEFGIDDGAILSNRNLFFTKRENVPYCVQDGLETLEKAQEKGMEYESILEDPLFHDPENDDYTLLPDSPAFSMGFISWDCTKCGPREG